MMEDEIDILLVEDDPQDVQMTLRVFHGENVKNRIDVVRDGEEALDFLFCRGAFSSRSPAHRGRVGSSPRHQKRSSHEGHSRGHTDFVRRAARPG